MHWYRYNNSNILLNDKNLKPCWVEIPVKYSEFFVKNDKDTLVITVGESWSYGESLPGVATGLQQYNLESQIEHCYGSQIAKILDADYYQYAVPGNCNLYVFQELDRILNYVSSMNYGKIYVIVQMTEPSREKAIIADIKSHPVFELYDSKEQILFSKWLAEYDKIFFKILDTLIDKYKNTLQIDCLLFKNFCRIIADYKTYNFNIVETSWIKFSASQENTDLDMPDFYSVGWLADIKETYSKRFSFDTEYLNKQLDIIEQSNKFLLSSTNHCPHPMANAHKLWANFLLARTRWLNAK